MGLAASLLYLAHLIGLALGLGSATVKTVLLFRCRKDPSFLPAFLRVSPPITRLLVTGFVLLVLSGAGLLFVTHDRLTPLLLLKLVLVAVIFGIGPVLDKVVAPQHERLAPAPGASPSPDFLRVERRFLTLESLATLLFYAVTALWVLR